jgi:phospholipid/cholesterol/gamma-HCH transport system substrate-binding protein
VIPAKPSLFNQLDKVLKEVSENVNKVSKKLGQVFSEENLNNFHKSLANIRTVTDAVAVNSQNLDQSIKDAHVLIKNLSEASHDFPDIATEFKSGLKKMSTMASSVSNAGNSVSSMMDSGKIAVDKISQQTVPPVVILIRRLDAIAANLEKVSAQMRQNPSVVIRGTTPPQPGPGE